jgi:hypothetical protein
MRDNTSIADMTNLIAFFLERQRVVALAMLDIHPGPLQMAGTHILGIEIEPYVRTWRGKMKRSRRFRRNWQSGIWRGEWKHFAHGFGCLLTNLHTGEPIEWDAPDLQAFEKWWFWNHLEWRVKQETDPHIVETRLEQLQAAFQQMRETGLLVPIDRPSKLTFGQNRQNPD